MRVLVSAYACEPGKGSEPGAGWNWLQAIAMHNQVCVITRSNNIESIQLAAKGVGLEHVEFHGVDLPPWARRWKRGGRGIRTYYLLWQVAAGREARKLHACQPFDLVHHLTFANAWVPALACWADAPFVFGPVAGGQRVPTQLLTLLGPVRGTAELASHLYRRLQRANPLVVQTWSRADLILATNDETKAALPARLRRKTRICGNACVPIDFPSGSTHAAPTGLVAICAGRLNRFKAVSLAIRAVALLPEWSLLVVGDGPERESLQRLAHELGVEARVSFIRWLPQSELWERMSSSRVLVLPTLKEGSPFVAAEAQALGLPVVALDQGGARVLARTPGAWFELIPTGPARAVVGEIAAALERIARDTESRVTARFDVASIADEIDAAYQEVVGAPTVDDPASVEREIGLAAS